MAGTTTDTASGAVTTGDQSSVLAAGRDDLCRFCGTYPTDDKSCVTRDEAFSCAWMTSEDKEAFLKREQNRIRDAAPDMLKALELLMAFHEGDPEGSDTEHDHHMEVLNVCRAAIAKARGQS